MDGFLLVAAKSFWLQPANWWFMAQVLFGLGAVIFVHELGHFLVAKMCGVKCDKFYVGFDAFDIKIGDRVIVPRSLIKFQWGETEYGIGILPLGGYVKMMGQDDNPGNIEKEIERSINEGETSESAYTATGLVDRSKIDQRSFLAKSVPQRMAIISAGVVFNLIFAVLFAAWAFKSGVDYEPPIVGNVIGGGPAWENDLVGSTMLSIGGKKVDGYFTYIDMAQEIVFNGDEKDLKIEYLPYGDAEPKIAFVRPQKGIFRAAPDLPLIGVSRRLIPRIGDQGAIEGNTAANADPAIEPNDLVVEVNETTINTDIDLRRVLARDSDKVAEFVLEREAEDGSTETVRTRVDPNPMRRLGFSVGWLPFTAIRKGSPAEEAGLLVGDEIMTIAGEPRGDLLTFDQRMIQIARQGESVELAVKREGKFQTFSIQPVVPNLISDIGPNQPIAIDSLGVAIKMTRTVESLEPGLPAAESGMQIGDEILSVTYLLTPSQLENDIYTSLKKKPKRDLIEDDISWAEISSLLQLLDAGTELEFELKRDNTIRRVKMKTVASNEFFLETRGINLTVMQKHYKSDSWSDAFRYGYKRVGNDVKRVGTTLVKLIKGKISPTNLGGPGTIALAATSEASRGTSRLLLFLTFLSANLAIVNFLPIPILDGGHMLFLAYEGIFRRPVSEKVQVVLTYAGLMMILGLMLFVIFLDVGRISSLM
jgi:regulator of sigma E protease